jgi:hypothetical protein
MHVHFMVHEEFEDTKRDKKINKDLQNTTQKTKDRITRTPLNH